MVCPLCKVSIPVTLLALLLNCQNNRRYFFLNVHLWSLAIVHDIFSLMTFMDLKPQQKRTSKRRRCPFDSHEDIFAHSCYKKNEPFLQFEIFTSIDFQIIPEMSIYLQGYDE